MKKPNRTPNNLGIKVGSQGEVYWTNIKEESTNTIQRMEHEIQIHQAIIALAEQKIQEEKQTKEAS